MKVGFIGLGLIGGSIAKAIKRKLPETILIAYDNDLNSIKKALAEGILSSAPFTINEEFSDCDYIFLCAPVHSNTTFLPILKNLIKDSCILTDAGSVKSDIQNAIDQEGLSSYFIGGHPMAGSEKSGYENSNDHLIENAYYILTPTEAVSNEKVTTFQSFIEILGSIPLILTPDEHDFITGGISHLPHIVASSLVHLVKDNDSSEGVMKLVAAGGFKDITRIASSSPAMWEQICLTNKDHILVLLDRYIASLLTMKSNISNSDQQAIYHFFDTARDYRSSFVDAPLGPLKKVYALYCDIIDESGAIATIATILATNGISIKNIGVLHNREFEEGALRIEFEDESSREMAAQLLEKHRYLIYKM
jgi:prephenate dehydrogenase